MQLNEKEMIGAFSEYILGKMYAEKKNIAFDMHFEYLQVNVNAIFFADDPLLPLQQELH